MKAKEKLLLAMFSLLNLADLFFTWRLFEEQGALADEFNPAAKLLLSRYGWRGLSCFKLGTMLLVGLVLTAIVTRRPLLGRRVVAFCCILLAGVVLYSFVLLRFPDMVSHSGE